MLGSGIDLGACRWSNLDIIVNLKKKQNFLA